MDTKVVTAHVPIPLANRIDRFAAQLQRSRGWIMIQALSEWVGRQDAAAGFKSGFSETQSGFGVDTSPAARAAANLKTLRENTTLNDISWQELRDAGRR
jgi:predicted transcriptional regulator